MDDVNYTICTASIKREDGTVTIVHPLRFAVDKFLDKRAWMWAELQALRIAKGYPARSILYGS